MDDPANWQIDSFKIVDDFVLEIKFADGKVQVIDFSVINEPYWKDLKDLDYFNKVYLNDTYNLMWPPNLDFHPRDLYHWDSF